MAAGFKKATVNASKVPSTQTNFPAYVDLSRIGITTLAEAASVRCYSDQAKTTELPREIVSVTEMHVKISSLTSTVSIYVDWDGVRADYAVAGTYGRNNVWTGYVGVYHYDEDPASGAVLTDSTGNGRTGTAVSMVTGDRVAGKFGKAWQFDGVAKYAHVDGSASSFKLASISVSVVHKVATASDVVSCWALSEFASAFSKFGQLETVVYRRPSGAAGTALTHTTAINVNTNWHHIAYTGQTNSHFSYLDGAGNANDTNVYAPSDMGVVDRMSLGGLFTYNGANQFKLGIQEELRYYSGILSADWYSVENNNLMDEPTFWGSWTNLQSTESLLSNSVASVSFTRKITASAY